MGLSLKLTNVWRVIRDIDLEGIRRSVEARFELWLIAEPADDAQRLRALLSPGGEATPHPWLLVGARVEDFEQGAPLAAIVVLRRPDPSPALLKSLSDLRNVGVPIVTLVVGGPQESGVPRRLEAARVVAPALDSAAARDIGTKLIQIAGPERRLALARQLPALRPLVFDALIDETARANATFAFTTGLAESVPLLTAPMALGDMVVLTKNQLLLSYRLAVVSGRQGDPRQLIGEILGVLGGGLLFRQVARQLIGLVPVFGLLPKVAVAYSGTYAIGRAMAAWLTEGREVTTDAVKTFTSEGLDRGRDFARRLADQARSSGTRATRGWQRLRGQLPWIGR